MRSLMVRPRNWGFSKDMDSFFEDFFRPFNSNFDGAYVPAVDIQETENDVELTLEVPGMDKKDIKVWVENNVLTISGERKVETEEKKGNCIRSEIRSGSFSRSFRLPDTVDTEHIAADYKNGMLHVKLNKTEAAKPKQIEVKVS